jgi:hypothetical protein
LTTIQQRKFFHHRPPAPEADPAAEQPAEQAVEEPVEQLVEEPVEQLVKVAVEQLVEEPVEQLVEEPVEQLIQPGTDFPKSENILEWVAVCGNKDCCKVLDDCECNPRGEIYWWNQTMKQVTAIGAAKPRPGETAAEATEREETEAADAGAEKAEVSTDAKATLCKCAKQIELFDAFADGSKNNGEKAKIIGMLEVGEIVECLEECKHDPKGATRVKVKKIRDGTIGWVTVKGNMGTVYLERQESLNSSDTHGDSDAVVAATKLCGDFKIGSPALRQRVSKCLAWRPVTRREDMATLYEALKTAKDPAPYLADLMKKMEDGTFVPSGASASAKRPNADNEGPDSKSRRIDDAAHQSPDNARDGAERAAASVDYNSIGYPIRPGEKDCDFFLNNGWCSFASTCKFNHPEERVLEVVPLLYQGLHWSDAHERSDQLCNHFKIMHLHVRLSECLSWRPDTREEDMATLYEALKKAWDPAPYLVSLMKKMDDGTFVPSFTKGNDTGNAGLHDHREDRSRGERDSRSRSRGSTFSL